VPVKGWVEWWLYDCYRVILHAEEEYSEGFTGRRDSEEEEEYQKESYPNHACPLGHTL